MVKSLPAIQDTWVQSLGWENPLERKWQPTPVFVPGESHGERSPGGLQSKESDATERLTHLLME